MILSPAHRVWFEYLHRSVSFVKVGGGGEELAAVLHLVEDIEKFLAHGTDALASFQFFILELLHGFLFSLF